MINLKELLKSIEILGVTDDKDVIVSGISYHSKNVSEGHLFVCVRGFKTDGHKYLHEAAENGAVAAIVEEFQESVSIPQYLVKDSRRALALLGAEYYRNPSKELKMIGITATNGKTTTSFMTNAILENNGFKTGLIGTVAVKYEDTLIPSELTTPESLDLQHHLRQMADCNVSHVTMEVSSVALDMHRVDNVDYDIVTLNNISREHIDLHGSFKEYAQAKSALIRNAGQDCIAVLNLDCPHAAALVKETKAQTITFGAESKEGHICIKGLDLTTGRAKFTFEIIKPIKTKDVEWQPCEFPIELSVAGLHSVYNSTVAITIGLLCGVPIPVIQKSLKFFEGVERRFMLIFEDDIKIIDDHFANSGNINVTLGTMKYMDYERLHIVYAIRGERGPTVNRENSEAIAEWSSKLGFKDIIATKSVSHVTDKDRVTPEELEVFLEVMKREGIKVILFDELPDAIAHALSRVQSGDLILLAGCQGMDYGAEIALKQLHKIRPEFPEDKLFYALRNRVAGVS